MDLATPNISIIIFWIICIILAIATFIKKYSLIPLMGVTTCLYLLTGMTKSNWAWFLGWLGVGLIIYFIYGYSKSKLALKQLYEVELVIHVLMIIYVSFCRRIQSIRYTSVTSGSSLSRIKSILPLTEFAL